MSRNAAPSRVVSPRLQPKPLPKPRRTSKLTVARDVMNPSVLVVADDMTVSEAAAFLSEHDITGAPVVDPGHQIVGVISATDISASEPREAGVGREGPRRRGMGREDLGGLRIVDEGPLVRDIMTPTVFTIPDDTPAPDIARAMIAGRIHRLFVTRRKRVVGIVTSLDLLKLLV